MQCQNNSLNGSLYFRIVFWIIVVNPHINCPSQFIPTVLHGLSQGWFFFDSSKTCKNDQTWSYPLAHQQVKYCWHLTAQCPKRLFLPVRPPSGKILGIQNQKFLNAGRSKCVGCFQYGNFHNVSGHIVAITWGPKHITYKIRNYSGVFGGVTAILQGFFSQDHLDI